MKITNTTTRSKQNLYFEDTDTNQDGLNDTIVVRDNGESWSSESWGVGDYRGVVIANIPYPQRDESRAWAIAIAEQMIEKISTRSLMDFDESDEDPEDF